MQKNVQGYNWITKYPKEDVTVVDHSREVDFSIVVLGMFGLINMTAFFFVWGYFLGPTIVLNDYDFYWFAWFFGFIVHEIFWGFLTVLWPLAYIGDPTVLSIIDFWISFIMYGGVYGAYEVLFIMIVIGVLFNIDGGWEFDVLTSWIVTGGYALLATLDGVVCWFFYPQWHLWYLKEWETIQAEIEAEKAARGGTIATAQNVSNGPIIFNTGKDKVDNTNIDTDSVIDGEEWTNEETSTTETLLLKSIEF
jgi:hypothetical protein